MGRARVDWWKENAAKFPNLSVMARQYLGCPASSATVERLFSQVGIAFSDRRKSASAATITDIIFYHKAQCCMSTTAPGGGV